MHFNLIVGTLTASGIVIGSADISEAELEILDGATVTTSELNLLDGDTSVGSSITLADNDGIIVNDGGTMKSIPASDVLTYTADERNCTCNRIRVRKSINRTKGLNKWQYLLQEHNLKIIV